MIMTVEREAEGVWFQVSWGQACYGEKAWPGLVISDTAVATVPSLEGIRLLDVSTFHQS